MRQLPTRRQVACGLALLPLIGCTTPPSTVGWPTPADGKPSVTYLHLLAKTPFFIGLTKEQLQYVIENSREWQVPAGSEISRSALGPDNFWILLDGGWQIEQGSVVAKSGNADSGKWYGGAPLQALNLQPTRLVATAPSYVMQIRQAQLDEMIGKRGYEPMERQLQRGNRFYRNAFK